MMSPLALCNGAACLPVMLALSSYDTQDSMPSVAWFYFACLTQRLCTCVTATNLDQC